MILNGWKEIAGYLDRGVRTVQRWEGFGLPIRRPVGGVRSSVITTTDDLDRWIRDFALSAGATKREDADGNAEHLHLLIRTVQQRRREQRELCDEQHRLVTQVTAERKAALETARSLLQKFTAPRNGRPKPQPA